MFSLQGFIHDSGVITILVLFWLSIYFIATVWIFIYRFKILRTILTNQNASLNSMLNNKTRLPLDSFFKDKVEASKEFVLIWKNNLLKQTTSGLIFLSIIASTAPFIGLFGTVVEILDAFGKLGGSGQISFDVIAPIISQALVATAAGILVAIPAYSFFLVLKRKAFEINIAVQMQLDVMQEKK